MTEIDVRKGMPAVKLDRAEFEKRYRSRYADPAFQPLQKDLMPLSAPLGTPIATRASPLSPARQVPGLPIPITTLPLTGCKPAP
jgi:hypothetical protein